MDTHLLDGDENKNKFVAEVKGDWVVFATYMRNDQGKMVRRQFARVRKGRIIALADVLKD